MEGPQRRDINELLTTGFFKTSRARSPSSASPVSSNAPSFLKTLTQEPPRHRSRSRGPRRPLPPRPIVEDEVVSLSRESSVSLPSYDPPLRGIIDQNPIILEAGVDEAETARLQKIPCSTDDIENSERRFVFIPKLDSDVEEATSTSRSQAVQGEKTAKARPHLEKRPSRQDLPSLETKVPRDIPPKFRRSASATPVLPNDRDATPKAQAPTPKTPSGEYFLSPEVQRGNKEYFPQSASRHGAHDSLGGRNGVSATEKRHSGSSYAGSRPGTPEKRNTFEGNVGSSRRPTKEKITKPQPVVEQGEKRSDRYSTTQDRLATGLGLGAGIVTGISTGRSSRSSNHSQAQYSSSEDDYADSGSEQRRRRRPHDRLKRDEYGHRSVSRHSKSSLEPTQASRLASPLPSPRASPSSSPKGDPFERADTFPLSSRRPVSRPVSPFDDRDTPRANKLNPMDAPKLRQSSTAPQPTKAPYPETFPMPLPGDIRQPNYPSSNNTIRPAPAGHWQPPPFQPSNQHLDKPVGSYRRISEDIERGSIAPLPSCPRTTPVRGKNDWLTLPQSAPFDICPSCYNSLIVPTEFASYFVPVRRNPDIPVICDFGSSPWYRIAWLLTLKDKRRDLKLFYGLADIADRVQPCLRKNEGVRQWHSIIDPKTGRPLTDFDACYNCVKSVETLLPDMRGVFIPTNKHGALRVCDLRFDSKRFVQYFDALETAADKARRDDGEPDTRALASLARRLTMFDECEEDRDLIDRRWNVITQLPEFTVCDECFDEVVWPEFDEGKAIPMMFAKDKKRMPKASCQLYSTRMRGIFRLAVDSNDYMMLATKARERKAVEVAYKKGLSESKRGSRSGASERELSKLAEDWRKWE